MIANRLRLRRIRKEVLDEHHKLYLGPECTPHGAALLKALIHHPSCGHTRWVIDWEADKVCAVCEGLASLARADAFLQARVGDRVQA